VERGFTHGAGRVAEQNDGEKGHGIFDRPRQPFWLDPSVPQSSLPSTGHYIEILLVQLRLTYFSKYGPHASEVRSIAYAKKREGGRAVPV
jgi:hypothetical protein